MDLSALDKEYWSNEMQIPLYVENTAMFLADYEPSRILTADGRKYHKPIISTPKTGTYTPYNSITDGQLKSSDQFLEVDQFKYASDVIDDTDKKQNFYDATSFAAQSMQKQLNSLIEQHWLSQVVDAQHVLDAGSVGGTPGTYLTLTTANAIKVFTAGHTKLDSVDAPSGNRYAIIGAHTLATLREVKADRQSTLGDTVLDNGIVGNWLGWTIVVNNNLPYSALLGLATEPTDGDTITIAGVTFTFKTTLGSTAGNVLIGGSASAARANLASAVNGTSGAGTTYVEVSIVNRFTLEKRSIAITSAASMALTGFGDIVVSETLTDGTDAWSEQRQKSVFMVRGAIDLAVQMPASVEIIRANDMFANKVRALEMYKAKAFDDGARLLISVNIDASQWV